MNVTEFLDQRGIDYQVYPHEKTYDAQHMAQSLHVPGQLIAKTVMVRADGGFKHVVLIVPASQRVDLRRVSHALGGAKIELATEPEIANLCPGCEFGVVPVFGSQFGLETMVDESITRQEYIFFQGDRHDQTIRMSYEDFSRIELPLVAAIADRNRLTVLVT
jgi:Ala-tRNA(Pro) deacylase